MQAEVQGHHPTNPKQSTVPNLLAQNFSADAPNQKWVSDITAIVTREGWLTTREGRRSRRPVVECYLAVVLDLFSRQVIGWAMSQRMTDDLTLKALSMALQPRCGSAKAKSSGLVFHSDRGSQYASNAFKAELHKHHLTQSMSGTGNCFDNAVSESFLLP